MNNKANGKTGLGLTSFFTPSFPFSYPPRLHSFKLGRRLEILRKRCPFGHSAGDGLCSCCGTTHSIRASWFCFCRYLWWIARQRPLHHSRPHERHRRFVVWCFRRFGNDQSKRHGFGISSSHSAMDSWFFRLVSTARIFFAYLVHGSVRFTDRNHSS